MASRLLKPSARCRVEYFPKTASNAQVEGEWLYLTSNKVSKTASAANAAAPVGLALRTVASTDSDYAGTTKVPVLIDEDGIWEIPVGVATSFGIGVVCDAHSDGQTLACNGSTHDTFVIVGGSTTTAQVRVRRWQTSDNQAVA